MNGLFDPFKNPRERKEIERKERLTGKDDIVISFISDPVPDGKSSTATLGAKLDDPVLTTLPPLALALALEMLEVALFFSARLRIA